MPAALLGLILAACAGEAPSLPADTTSVNRTQTLDLSSFSSSDVALSCGAIAAERQTTATEIMAINKRISGDRVRDQVVYYFVPLSGPILDSTHDDDRAAIKRLYARQDTLIQLGNVKKCGAPPATAAQ